MNSENKQSENTQLTNDALTRLIDKAIEKDVFTIDISKNPSKYIKITVQDYVDINTLSDVVHDIVYRVRINDFKYEVIDFILGYYVIKLFTNIPVPMIENDDSDPTIDYARCYDICTRLDLINQLCSHSDNITEYISIIEKNVWRKLEYDKAMESNENLNLLYGRAYNFIDNLDNLLSQVDDLGLNKIASELIDVTQNLSLVEKNK